MGGRGQGPPRERATAKAEQGEGALPRRQFTIYFTTGALREDYSPHTPRQGLLGTSAFCHLPSVIASAASLVLQAGGGLGLGGDGGLDLLGGASGVEPRGVEGERLRGKLGRRAEVEARTLVARG